MSIRSKWVSCVVLCVAAGCAAMRAGAPPPGGPDANDPSLADCVMQDSSTPDLAVPSDPHGQGELLGIGLSGDNPKMFSHADQFSITGLTTAAGVPITNVTVTAHALDGSLRDGPKLTADDWNGVVLTGRLHCTNPAMAGKSRAVTVRIMAVSQLPTSVTNGPPTSAGKSWVYQLQLDPGDSAGARPACGGNADVAFPIPGFWDDHGAYTHDGFKVSFACVKRSAALCLRQGYSDDPAQLGTKPDLFKACARMAVADYCGDGGHYTKEGVEVRVWDDPHGALAPPPATMAFEAAWTAKGLVCSNHPRLRPEEMNKIPLPSCFDKQPRCDTAMAAMTYSAGAPLLFSASCTPGPCMASERATRTATKVQLKAPRTRLRPR